MKSMGSHTPRPKKISLWDQIPWILVHYRDKKLAQLVTDKGNRHPLSFIFLPFRIPLHF